MDKLAALDEDTKLYYVALSKKLLSYSGISSLITYDFDEYFFEGRTLCKIGIAGRTLAIYLSEGEEKDFITAEEFKDNPYMIVLGDEASVNHALKCIEDFGLKKKKTKK